MYPDIQDKNGSTHLGVAYALLELVWIVPLLWCTFGYYWFDLRGWILVSFIAMSILASACFAFFFVADFRERRAKRRNLNRR